MFKPNIITSTGRTGTVTLSRVFAGASDVQMVRHEPTPDLWEQAMNFHRGAITPRAVVQFMQQTRPTSGSYLEVNPRFSWFPSLALDAFPDAKIAFIVRDPATYLTSSLNKLQRSSPRRNKLRLKARDFLDFPTEFSAPEDSAFHARWNPYVHVAWVWYKINSIILKCCDEHPARTLWVYFESLFDQNLSATQVVASHLGVHLNMPQALPLAQVRHNAQPTDTYGPWETFPAAERAFIAEMLNPLCARFGYGPLE